MEPPCQSASLPSPDTPRIPEAWFSYLGDWPKQRWGPERAVCTEPCWGKAEAPGSILPLERSLPTSSNHLRHSANLPSPRPSPSELLELSGPPYPPCGSPAAIMGTLGLAPSPACLLTQSLWLPGAELYRLVGRSPLAPAPPSAFAVPFSGASRLPCRGCPLPLSSLPTLLPSPIH